MMSFPFFGFILKADHSMQCREPNSTENQKNHKTEQRELQLPESEGKSQGNKVSQKI